MNTEATTNTSFQIFNTGKTGYTQQVPTNSPRPSGKSHKGETIVDLTDDDAKTYHVTSQDLQSIEVDPSPYKISIKTRLVKNIDKDEQKTKWEEIRHPKRNALLTRTGELSWENPSWEKMRCEIFNPKRYILWALLLMWAVFFIVPVSLWATTPKTTQNNIGVIMYTFWSLLGVVAAGTITACCYYRDKIPTQHEIDEIKTGIKREEIYNMYCHLHNTLVKNSVLQDNVKLLQQKMEGWFKEYNTKIEEAQLKTEDKSAFHQLLHSHQTVLSDLIIKCNASWISNESIMAKNLDHLLCSEDANCRQLTETWVTEFKKLGKYIFRYM